MRTAIVESLDYEYERANDKVDLTIPVTITIRIPVTIGLIARKTMQQVPGMQKSSSHPSLRTCQSRSRRQEVAWALQGARFSQ